MVTIANRMPLIEGVGDEVIFFAGLMVLVICIVLAWFSTSVSEQPLIRTAVLVIERRHTSVAASPNQPEIIETQSQSTISEHESTSSKSSSVIKNPSSPPERELNNENIPGTSNKGRTDTAVDENGAAGINVCTEISLNRQQDGELAETGSQNVISEKNIIQSDIKNESIRHRNLKSNTSRVGDTVADGELVRNAESNSVPIVSAVPEQPKNDEGRILTQQWVELSSSENLTDTSSISDIAGIIRIRLKFLNDSQRLVEGKLEEPLGDFKRRYFREELENDKTVRLIFNGQLLRSDQETLQFYGLFDNCVVHCQISNNVSSPATLQTENYAELDVSRFMLPLFGVILGVIWYCRIQYRQFFNATSTFALLGITGLFFVSLVALFIPRREHRQAPWFN